MRQVLAAVPVKPFDTAKRRLAESVPPSSRRDLSRSLASRTLHAVEAAGALPLVLAADAEVAAWASELGQEVLVDRGAGLDRAARAAVALAATREAGWLICHADLPLLESEDLAEARQRVAAGGTVIAPSTDGGTSLAGGSSTDFPFSYGPGSFHRHLAALAGQDPLVLSSPGLTLDLDTPDDLAAACSHPRGSWIADLLAGTPAGTLPIP